jgi:hypothetical protein
MNMAAGVGCETRPRQGRPRRVTAGPNAQELHLRALGMRAVGMGPGIQARVLLSQGFGASDVLGLLLGLEEDPRKKLEAAVQVADGLIPLSVVCWSLQAHGVHPVSLALAQNPSRVQEFLERMSLTQHFSDWKISGNTIEITADSALESLPTGLVLPGWNLAIKGCPRLRDLGAELVVETLKLQGCPSLRRLPSGLGNIEQNPVQGSTSGGVPSDLKTAMVIHLSHCLTLENLEGLQTANVARFANCGGSSPFAAPFRARIASFRNCPDLERLPEGIRVQESFELDGLPRLRELPSGLVLGRDLVLRNCGRFERLPEGLEIPGDLVLEGLPSLRELPVKLKVGGTIRVLKTRP